jgi:hypothetical protein
VGSAILSLYRCQGGACYQGSEHLMQMNPHHYEAWGVLMLDERRLSSWHVGLTRT